MSVQIFVFRYGRAPASNMFDSFALPITFSASIYNVNFEDVSIIISGSDNFVFDWIYKSFIWWMQEPFFYVAYKSRFIDVCCRYWVVYLPFTGFFILSAVFWKWMTMLVLARSRVERDRSNSVNFVILGLAFVKKYFRIFRTWDLHSKDIYSLPPSENSIYRVVGR